MADPFGLILGIGTTAMNNAWADARAREDRAQNYMYNEMAAQNADKRTRALYEDYYSPEALMRQYNEAGLSPSLMFGGTPGQGGMAGAKGNGASGPQTPFMPLSAIEIAQIGLVRAETEKTKAETANVKQDTINKQAQELWQTYVNEQKLIETRITTKSFLNDKGEYTSLFELANTSYDYDNFLKNVKSIKDDELQGDISTEEGQKVLRSIFLNANRMERDIKVLSEEGVNADFQKSVLETLSKEGFAQQNATTCIKQLEAAAEVADLTKEQRGAWNNIIESLRKKNSTVADIIIVMSMIFNQAASHWNAGPFKQ